MGFAGQSAQAHAARTEAGADAFDALHLIQGHCGGSQLELQQVPQGHHRSVFQQGLVSGEVVVTRALSHRLVQRLRQLGIVAVVLSTTAVLNEAHEFELAAVELRESLGVHRERFVRQLGQRHAGNTTGRSGEGGLHHIRSQADRFKDLSAVVAGQQ